MPTTCKSDVEYIVVLLKLQWLKLLTSKREDWHHKCDILNMIQYVLVIATSLSNGVSGNGPVPGEYVEAFDHVTSKVHTCKPKQNGR